MTSQSDRYFSVDYQEARGKFLAAAERAGAYLEHHELPDVRGPDGRALFMDIGWIGPRDADVVLLSLSGTHGAEGFCGSAAQTSWLDELSAAALPAGVAQLFVHAVNPFGFAHMVRCNENNVDLNRNCIDYSQPLPENPLYEQLHSRLPQRVGYDEDLVAEWTSVVGDFWAEHGDWKASDAATRGQYTRPDGIHYGGARLQWSVQTLTARVRVLCARARHIVYIDWHSLIRIGDGKLLFLCFNETDGPLYRRVGSWWSFDAIDRKNVDKQWGEGITRAGRRPSRNGLLMWGVQHAVAPQADLAGAVIEFCADADRLHSDLRFRMRVWLHERWLMHTRQHDTPTGRDIVARLRESMSPTRRSFQEPALESAWKTYEKALEGATIWARENTLPAPGTLVCSAAFE